MYDTPFHCEVSQNLKSGLRTNARPKSSRVMWIRSPYASERTNSWLEHKMLRLYTIYYKKVMRESRGRFWEERVQAIGRSPYTAFCGGDTNK